MAANVVGSAYIVVRAITAGVDKDIKNGFKRTGRIGDDAGDEVGRGFRRGFGRSTRGNLFGNLIKESLAAKQQFTSLTRAGYVLAPAITAVAGVIGNLITGIISLASTIGYSLVPALAVAGQSFSALAQGAITAKLAFMGVGKAIQAGSKAAKGGASNAKALEKAQKALERARRSLAEAEEDAAKRETEAKTRLTEAENDLSKAREKAIEDLQQLGFDSEDAALAEQKAALELEKARESLARVSDLPPNSRARKEAELAFAQADLNYRRAIDANSDLKKEEAKNAELAKKGPNALVDGQENVVDALKKVADAEENLTETRLQSARAILAATEARDDAKEAVADLEAGGSAADEYANALSDLSEAAQTFVKFIVEKWQPAVKGLRDAAAEGLFPGLQEAMENLITNLFPRLEPLLKSTGKVLGEIAKEFSNTITKGENLDRLERIWKSNEIVLTNFGDAASNLYEVFLILLDAARPLTEEFSKFVANTTAAWRETLKADEASGKLAKKFDIARGILKDLGTIFGNTFRGLGNLFAANVGPGSGGQIFLDYLKNVTKAFENLKTIDGKPIKEFFADAAVNGTKLLDLLGKIFGAFIGLADNPELGIFYDQLGKAVDIFADIGEGVTSSLPAFGSFIIEFSKFVKLVTDSGSITVYFNTLKSALEKVNQFLSSDLGQSILRVSAQILPLLAAFGLVAQVAGFFGKVVIGAFTQMIGPIMKVKDGFLLLQAATGLATGPLLAIIAAVVALIAIFVGAYQNSEKLREAISKMVEILKDVFIDTVNDVKETIAQAFPRDSVDKLKEALKNVGDFLSVTLIPVLTVLGAAIIGTLGGAIKSVIFLIKGITDAFQFVVNFIKGVIKLISGDFEGAGKAFKDAFSNAFSFVQNLFKSLTSVFVGPLNGVISAINSAFSKISVKIPDWVPIFGGKTFSIPPIPKINLAEGGIVMPSSTGTIARIAEAGRPERVEPLDPDGLSKRDKAMIDKLSGGGKNVTVNVYPSAGMDERELASIVSRQIAFQLRKGAA